MISCTITFIDRAFCIGVWNNDVPVLQYTDNAAELLPSTLDDLLKKIDVSIHNIDKIGFLVGPGSFTSIRVTICTILAIKLVYPDKIYLSMQLQEAIYSHFNHASTHNLPIVIKCNHKLFHVYTNHKWNLLNIDEINEIGKYITLAEQVQLADSNHEAIIASQEMLQHGVYQKLTHATQSNDIIPFYGFDLI